MPFVSYPYEWPFSMLKDAALLQLELNRRALRADLALKDATPYNVQWRGTRPVFIDVGSFERLRPGEPWAGYRQFCMLFLYPLMLQAYKDLPFHAALRGVARRHRARTTRAPCSPASASARACCPTCSCTRGWSRATPTPAGREVKREMKRAGFSKELLAANFGKLEKLVRAARVEGRRDRLDRLRRGQHLRRGGGGGQGARSCARRPRAGGRRLAWDVGCNDGRYARIAAESADLVVALRRRPRDRRRARTAGCATRAARTSCRW